MSILDGARESVQKALKQTINWAMSVSDDPLEREYARRALWSAYLVDYYMGVQKKSLKAGRDGKDFNVTINLASLVVDRSVSMLFGAGIDFENEDETADQFIESVWDANGRDILLHDVGQNGAIYGTPYIKIVPYGRKDREGKDTYRLIALSPMNMIIGVNPHDVEEVVYYVNRYNVNEDGRNVAYREVFKKNETNWSIIFEKSDRTNNGRWTQLSDMLWDYEFPPIVHGKNLPHAGTQYGRSDIEDVLGLQDDYNAAFSNVNKILWFHGHPHLWTNGKIGDALDWSTEKILELKANGLDKDARLEALQLQGDLQASREFYNDIRRDLMDVSRTTDIETIKDKAGGLTNFGLRVLFKDELAKLETKRLLYGEMITEVNQRLLSLQGMNVPAGEVHWRDVLPSNENEQITALKTDLELGIVSRETVSMQRGYEWEEEKEKIANEKTAAGNIGGSILTQFLRGQGQQGRQEVTNGEQQQDTNRR